MLRIGFLRLCSNVCCSQGNLPIIFLVFEQIATALLMLAAVVKPISLHKATFRRTLVHQSTGLFYHAGWRVLYDIPF